MTDPFDTQEESEMSSATRKPDLHEQEFIEGYCVSTVALGIEHPGGTWYETYIFPADGEKITDWIEVWGDRYVTREGAMSGHADTCEKLRAGTLEGLDAAWERATLPSGQPDATAWETVREYIAHNATSKETARSKKPPPPRAVIQETGSNGITVYWDSVWDRTTIYVPCVDANGRHYLREIIVAGNNVIDLGRDSA